MNDIHIEFQLSKDPSYHSNWQKQQKWQKHRSENGYFRVIGYLTFQSKESIKTEPRHTVFLRW